jgi:acyl transferase domain-containing protein
VVKETQSWKARIDERGNPMPRRAGVSSFGFGGVNAHVILEEYIEPEREGGSIRFEAQRPALIVLSAKTAERLQEQARRLLDYLRAHQFEEEDLARIAYTLQVGREAMDHRLAFTATTIMEVIDELTKRCAGHENKFATFERGSGRPNRLGRDDLDVLCLSWTKHRQWNKLRDAWLDGMAVTWAPLYENKSPRRISLPTYPFERKRYWAVTEIWPLTAAENSNDISPRIDEELALAGASVENPAGEYATHRDSASHFRESDLAILKHRVIPKLARMFGDAAKIAAETLNIDEPLSSYGLDSLLIVELNEHLSQAFPKLPKTIWFEYQTLTELAEYLLDTQTVACEMWVGFVAERKPSFPMNRNTPAPALTKESPTRVIASERKDDIAIAIIGIAGQYPLASNLGEYWNNLATGRNCITVLEREGWDLTELYEPDVETAIETGKSYCKWGGLLEDFACFDPMFFQISPAEAFSIDPQERIFLQSCWEVIEDAGYTREQLNKLYAGRIGVFAGITKSGFDLMRNLGRRHLSQPRTSFSSVANRVSYYFDWHGPSMPIDTMCSSSLTAIHVACGNIRAGECELAIAGGVNIYHHPSSFVDLCAHRMLSREGKCSSFGIHGDGFVPGEGVGTVLLKPLKAAIADGDHIYGVVRGTSVNHGGKTNGYTVPNPRAQSEVILEALSNAKVNPRAVSYIEAHGTGTRLGDPIEIAGLTQAFSQYTDERGFCSVGSAKTNIGHLEAAAGIAGVTKVLLQMQNGTLVPSLHAEVINPNIDFGETPFVLQRSSGEWRRPIVRSGNEDREILRIAGVSSFGAAGVNAHVILEEYIEPEREGGSIRFEAQRPALIVLSAKTAERLQEQARRLLDYLRAHQFEEEDLARIAYTLQVGREAMDHRLAFTATTMEQLCEKLTSYVGDRVSEMEEAYQGEARKNKEALSLFAADEDLQRAVANWAEKSRRGKLLDIWTKGFSIDWTTLYKEGSMYGEVKLQRISLPTYPFARERYWVEGVVEERGRGAELSGGAILHPLLQRNTSDFTEQRFSSVFEGTEFYLSDHRVGGEAVLPGVCYLEMARAGLERSESREVVNGNALVLRNVVWLRPLVVKESREVHIRFSLQEQGEVAFEIYTGGQGSEEVMHAQGRAAWGLQAPEVDGHERLSLGDLQAQCDTPIDIGRCYRAFSDTGVEYGPAHRGLSSVQLGEDSAGERFVLAQIKLPECVGQTRDQYVLHPSLLDGALQAAIAFTLDKDETSAGPMMPFTLGQIEIIDKIPTEIWVIVRTKKTASLTAPAGLKIDIEIVNETGNLCVKLTGLLSCTPRGEEPPAPRKDSGHCQAGDSLEKCNLWLTPHWEAESVPPMRNWTLPAKHVLLVGGTAVQRKTWLDCFPETTELTCLDTVHTSIESQFWARSVDHVVWISPDSSGASLTDEVMLEQQTLGVLSLYRLIKVLLKMGYGRQKLGWTVITRQTQATASSDKVDPTHAGVHGLIGSLAKEYSNWRICLVDLDKTPESLELTRQICHLPVDSRGDPWVHRDSEWYRCCFHLRESHAALKSRFRNEGVYLVVGGAGGIGEVFTEYLIRNYGAHVIWIGRRVLDTELSAKIARLSALGPAPTYISADATSRDEMSRAEMLIRTTHPTIHGVIHATVELSDTGLANMEEEDFLGCFAAKAQSSVRIAQMFATPDLDMVIFFSSMQSYAKAAGQSNYAAGCTFVDAFARACEQRGLFEVKIINWGYWGSVGIVASNEYRQKMRQHGIGSIEPPEGMEALEHLLSGELSQLIQIRILDSEGLASLGKVTDHITSADA